MKDIKEYVFESVGSSSKWSYLCCLLGTNIDFCYGGFWNPKEKTEYVKDKLVFVRTDKNLNDDNSPMVKAFDKKYGDDWNGHPFILVSSIGDEDKAKLIKKMYDAYDKGKLTFDQIMDAWRNAHNVKNSDYLADSMAKELNIK